MTKDEIGIILKQLRLKTGKTQKEVAEILGRTQQVIGHWETGYSQPDANTLFLLCDLYNASIDEAFGFKKKSTSNLETNEQKLLDMFRLMNKEGQEKLINTADDMIASQKYKIEYITEVAARGNSEQPIKLEKSFVEDALGNYDTPDDI